MHALNLVTLLSLFTVITCLPKIEPVKTYHVIKVNKLSWHAAFRDCMTRGLQLCSITTNEEQLNLEAAMKSADVVDQWLWTAGTDQGEEGNFYWMTTGQALTYRKFSVGQPDNAGGNENCLHIWRTSGGIKWNDWMCNQKLYYICEEKPIVNNCSVV